MFHDNLGRKINLSNEIGLSAQYVTQWDATSFLFIDPPWIKAHFPNVSLRRGSRSRMQAFNQSSSENLPFFPFDSGIRSDYRFELDNLCDSHAISFFFLIFFLFYSSKSFLLLNLHKADGILARDSSAFSHVSWAREEARCYSTLEKENKP